MRLPALAATALLTTVAAATFVRADEGKTPDLAARCDAVDWDGLRNNGAARPDGIR